MTRASGKARRWPDLLIGLLVLLLLGGFAFLLVGQRPEPVAQTPTPTTPPATEPTPEPITIPTAPGTEATEGTTATVTPPDSSSGTGDAAPPTATETPTEQPTPSTSTPPAAATTDTGGASGQDNGDNTAGTTEIPVVPAAPIEEAPSASTTTPDAEGSETTTSPSTTTPPDTTTPPRAAAPVATSEQRTPLRSDYRVSLGSFATRRTAERLTQGVSDLGYTVYPIDLGDQVVAQIGPFEDEANARRALADIRRAYPGAVLYPPRGRSLKGDTTEISPPPAPTPATPDTNRPSTSAPTSAAPAPATESPAPPEAVPAPAPTTPTPPTSTEPKASAPAAPSGPVYLQLGAFDQVESAQGLVSRLRNEGYAPTVNAPDGRKVTVLVGPFSGSALTNAETNLAASGHDFFRVR
ncbi:hypothetical protein DAETH_10580 [Deinococcus aetherius]|uniref:SPOR domain-containing protein n=1 Tax=Deinococcus aetherius TaxID=200252 RepID=A0ABM8ABG3_9DEIO|nr:SPOR domain-containing protein [Deinococcus aetherius]BDP41089.1 hypothetical protein DAETH_10580 [Deinococcus aetherius]